MNTFRPLQNTLLAAATGLAVLLAAPSRADDLDIYTNAAVLPQQQPITFLALDLNISNPDTVLCDNVLLTNSQDCLDLRSRISFNDLLGGLGIPTVENLPANLPGAPVLLGLIDPNRPLSDLDAAARILLGSYLGTLASFVDALPTQPAIDYTNPASITAQQTYLLAVIDLITAFATQRAKLAIVLNHDDIGGVTRDPVSMLPNGTVPASSCGFVDASSLGGLRDATLGCSNGAYLFNGVVDLADPAALQALILKLAGSLLPRVDTSSPTPSITPPVVQPPTGFSAEHPYQTKEIYAEVARVLRGDAVYNGHLGYYDYGDRNPANNLNDTTPPLAWDTNAESGGSYRSPLAASPQACTINLVHVQNTNAARQQESNALITSLFPFADADGDNTVTVPELSASAATDGLTYRVNDRRLINSLFVIEETLDDAASLTQRGESVVGFTDALNLLGRGNGIAATLVRSLDVDTSLGSVSTGASRSERSGTTNAAYLPVFRPEKNQRPAWVGNVKRLRLRQSDAADINAGLVLVDARDNPNQTAVPAIAADGRIRNGALTFWTNPAQLGTGVSSDGRKADLGGAGQRIPGFRFGGGGDPGRGGGGSARTVYYDSTGGGTQLPILNADDEAVRAELLAATGATAVTLPDPNCALNCQAARATRDAACNAAGAFTQTCADENTACRNTCASGNFSAVCNAENATCLGGCAAGLAGTACRALCGTALTACPASKLAGCVVGCDQQLALCPASKQTQCLLDSAAQDASCRVACQTTRSADTLVRELLLYARGYDVGTRTSPKGSGAPSSPTNSGISGRPWLMGAVLHSRPLAINYGRRAGSTTDVVRVVFGSADGMLRMVDDATGTENWAFMPQAVMGSLATLRDNAPGSLLPYGVDGSPVVLIRDRAPSGGSTGVIGDVTGEDGDRVLLFFGLRRGGAAYYALDVTDPDRPQLAWRLSSQGLHRNGTLVAGSAAQFSSLALAFSTPQVGRVRIDASGAIETSNNDVTPTSVLIFGGGYHGGRDGSGARVGKDLNNSRATAPTSQVGRDDSDTGNALFMVNAATGELVWRAVRGASAGGFTATNRSYAHPMLVNSMASDVTVVDTDNDGFSDRLYVGDTGGRLWRADFASLLPTGWTLTPIASVGRHTSATPTVAEDRRIFFAPDYVPLRGIAGSGLDLVLFGSGDREDPLNLTTEDWFYGLIDPDLVSGKTAAEIITTEDGLNAANRQHADFDDVSNRTLTNLNGLTTGYRIRFPRKGEKMFSAPVTLGGTVTFTSYIPPDPSDPNTPVCVPSEGASRLFSIGVQTTAMRGINRAAATARDLALPKPGLPGEINVLGGTNQSAGSEVFRLEAKESYPASWRERLGETQK